MAAKSQADAKRKYSWWWDSHISPKNSKWLQENLTDMDSKVKQMIKLIEEDADSFARRAEMYYKKRPELMKLVEEFYRAYRALAERYDHATGVIRQAHRTMAEAFPNQVPMLLADDLPTVPFMEAEPRTPEMMPHSSLAFSDRDEVRKGSSRSPSPNFHAIKRNGAFTEEPDSAGNRKGLKQLNDLFMPGAGHARKELNFHDVDNDNNNKYDGHLDSRAQDLSESERVTRAEAEILALKRALAKLENEKEAGLLQYQQSLERLSNLESEVSHAQENSQELNERASKAEAEVQTLKETLNSLQDEREVSLLQYQQCLEKVSNLEKKISSTEKNAGELNERVIRAVTEAESLKKGLITVEAEKEAALDQYKQCLETVSKLEDRLVQAEENARKINEQANKAGNEIEALKLEIAKLTEEKEDAALRYQQCLEIISSLEHKLSCAEEEVRRLNSKIDDSTEKLLSSEQKCLLLETSNENMQAELQSLVQKFGCQNEELSEKQQELGRLWNCIQEERLRFVEAETAFQTLQNLHSQSQEELRSIAAELHHKAELLENVEFHKQALEDEAQKVKQENKILNEFKISSSLSTKNLQDEILNLRQTIEKLEQEVELRVDERNALQQEIYCLKEELSDVNKRHDDMIEEVSSTGLDPQCFGLSVKELQDENSKLKVTCEADRGEKAVLLEKLQIMEKLLEKNTVLENSLSDLNVELESVRGKVQLLEETCQSLLGEKSTLTAEKATLFSQLQTMTEKLENVSEKNNLLENSLFDANAELEGLKEKSKSLEDSYQSLDLEKSNLISEKETLAQQLNIARQMLKSIENQHRELELKHLELKGEKESALQKVEELLVSFYAEREEHSRIVQLNERHLAEKELQLHIAQEDANCREKEYEEELDRAAHAEIEIFLLQKCIQDLEENNFSLLVEYQRLLEKYKISEKLLSNLENENVQKQVRMNSLFGRVTVLRTGLLQGLKTLDLNSDHSFEDMAEQDLILVDHMHGKIQERQEYLDKIFNESQHLAIENSVLVSFLGQLKLKAEKLVTERDSLDEELRIQSEQFLALQAEVRSIQEKNQELKLTISKGEQRIEEIATKKGDLLKQLSDLELAHKNLEDESCKTVEEKNSLMRRFLDLGEEKNSLEQEICDMIHETIAQSNISLIYQNIVFEKVLALRELSEDLGELCSVNEDLKNRLKAMTEKLEDVQMENSHLNESFDRSSIELKSVQSVNDQLGCQIQKGKELLSQKENELLAAAEMFSALYTEKTELQKMLEDLRCKYDEARVILDDQAHQILNLSSDKDCQNEELRCLREVNQKLESEMGHLCEELEETRLREEKLNYQLKEGTNEIKLWETQAATLYEEVQRSTAKETLIEGKFCEVANTCESQNEELRCLHEVNQKLESDMGHLCEELEETKLREEKLNYQLKEGTNEIELWETQAATLYEEVQRSTANETLIEGNFRELANTCESQNEELRCLHEVNQKLESEMGHLCEELEETRLREEKLNYQLKEGTNEIELWETQAATLYEEVQRSTANETLIEGKFREVANTCESQNEELRCLHEVNRKLESDMGHLCEELEETKLREEKLNYQLKEGTNEIELWETQAATLYEEVQRSTANETLIEGNFRELANTCESQNEELRCLHEVNQKLESEMGHLCEELEETRLREEKLNYQLKEGTNEIELWETQAATLYEEVQRSTANETLIEGNFRELANTCESQNEELRCLREVNQKLESEMGRLCEELEETILREEKLNYQLREGTNEIELWETQAAALYEEVQRSTASETLIEGKFHEVANTCESLEREHNNKSVEGEMLKERVSELKDQNGRLRDQLAAYAPAVGALKDCITSLEMQTLVHTELHMREKSKEDMMNHRSTEGGPQTSANQIAVAPDALPDIQEMQKKISAIEMAVKHLNENFKARNELREIQELQSSNHGTRINEGTINKQKTGKSISDIPAAENEVLTKDIILDQMSESSSYGISRRGTPEVDDQMLELWETVNKQQKATTGPANYRQKGVTKEPKNKYPTIESLVEKELSVDKLEISRRLTQPREEDNKPKIIERLDSDAQKLANLKITVQDLIKKVEATEKSTKGKGSEYDSVKGQLEVTEESITKLFDANRKLMKNVEEGKLSFVENPEPESDESGSISRRRASEQARRGSEKIGRLQLEVQRLQFLLLKLDEERESKGKAKMADRSPRVLLRDYLYGYGGTRSNQKKKRSHFCSCVHPPTKGD